jgi:microcystin-dependent protein
MPVAAAKFQKMFAASGTAVIMDGTAISTAGSNTPHPNLQPYLTLNFCIALQGIFPPRG